MCVLSLLITNTLYSANRCSTVFSEQPFTKLSLPTYDSEEYLAMIDRSPITIFSRILATKSRNWIVDLESQKDYGEVLSNLLTKSDLSMDESIYVLSQLILPKISIFQKTDIKKTKSTFYELIADTFGLNDFVEIEKDIRFFNQELTELLSFWSSQGLRRIYNEIGSLSELIEKTRDSYKQIRTSSLDLSSQELSDISDIISGIMSVSNEFKGLDRIILFNQKAAIKMVLNESKFKNPAPYCWYVYFNMLVVKTQITISKLFRHYLELQTLLRSTDISSQFLDENRSQLLTGISSTLKVLNKFNDYINKFQIEDIRVLTAGTPPFILEQVIKDQDSFMGLSNDQIYSGLSMKLSSSILRKYSYSSRTNQGTIFPDTSVIEAFINYLDRSYSTILIDRSSSTPIYEYFTDFSHLRSEDYIKELNGKYGKDFTQTLLSTSGK